MKIIKFLFKILVLAIIGYLVFYWYNNAIVSKKQKELNNLSTNVVENFYSQLSLNEKDLLSNDEYLDIAIFTDNLKTKLTRQLKTDPQYNFIICEYDYPSSFNVVIKEEYLNKNIYTISSDFTNHSFEVTSVKKDNNWYIDNINCKN